MTAEENDLRDLFADADVVSVADLADFLGVSDRWVRELCTEIEVPRIGNAYAITEDNAVLIRDSIDDALADDEDDDGNCGLEVEE